MGAPFDGLVGAELDMLSFVRDYVEFRIDDSIFRALTAPSGHINGVNWRFGESGAADLMRRYIGLRLVGVEHAAEDHITLQFEAGAVIRVSLRYEDRTGVEAVNFVPANADGRPDPARMWVS